jgi:hypothetical protein
MKRIVPLIAALAAALAASAILIVPSSALAASGPTVTTGAASAVNPTSATVSGTVNLNGATLASGLTSGCEFEYGTTTSLSASSTTAACATTPAATGTSTVTAALSSLTAGTTYYYQLAINTGGLFGLGSTETDGTPMMSFTTPTAGTPPTAVVAAPSAVAGTAATLDATVNPNHWSISSCSFSYTPSGGAASTAACAMLPTGAGDQTVSAAVSGLTEGQTYTYTLTIGYGAGSAAATVTSAGSSSFTTPSASVTTPTNLTSTAATLDASVNPEGQTVTSCTFYYGTSGPTLQTAPCAQATSTISGTSAITVSAAVTGLTAKTSYLDTIVLVTSGGATTAPVIDFSTPATPAAPTAKTTAPTAITATTATLHATVNAQGQGVRACEFEYGVNPLTSSSTPGDDLAYTQLCPGTPADSGNQTVSLSLKGLAPKTTYYYRVLFDTYGGYVIATARSFTTAAAQTVSTATPKLKIASVSINRKTRTAKFRVVRSGSVNASRGYQCALVKGRTGTPKYAKCQSFTVYSKLKSGAYVFYVRGANAHGEGTPVSHKFTV